MADLQIIIEAAMQLSPEDQRKLIEKISQSLEDRGQPEKLPVMFIDSAGAIPAYVRRTEPVRELSHLKGSFWPDDESADDINSFIARQRMEDLLNER
ncbi:MAG: hypothetical protein U0Z53_06070 [Blastocatellia bacterium]